MRLFEMWVESPGAGAIGWALMHSLWEGAIIAAVLAAALVVLRSARARYVASCLAMLALVMAFSITLMRLLPPSLATHTVKPLPFPGWHAPPVSARAGTWTLDLAALVPYLAPVWMGGVLLFYLRHLAGWISISRLRRRGVCCAPDRWQEQLTSLSARIHLSRPVTLLESCLADAPMVVGHFRPLILVPIGLLAGLPAGQVEAILLHELAHVRRYDYLMNLLQRSMEGLLFYHPAVWWISAVIRAERENCCDDLVVETGSDVHEYATALTALEKNRWSGREPAVAATGGNLMKRVRRLLYPTRPDGPWAPLLAGIILMATVAVTLTAWPAVAAGQNPANAQTKTYLADPSRYGQWLNQDVVYIIADQERDAFIRLTTDPERDRFIEQFWERRNPEPGSGQNRYKTEHYRRLAFANTHFASSRAGWQTDRGHMYIVYGPPDEIEDHSKDAQRSSPWEIWLYHHVDGIGDNLTVTFIDKTGTGDYRLAPGNSR